MPIPWAASTSDALTGLSVASEAELPSNDGALSLFASTVLPTLFSNVTPVGRATDGQAVNLRIYQTQQTHEEIGTNIAVSVTEAVISFTPAATCSKAALKTALGAVATSTETSLPAGSSLHDVLVALPVAISLDAPALAQTCGLLNGIGVLGPSMLRHVSRYFELLAASRAALSAVFGIAQIAYAANYWNATKELGVCMSSSGTVENCVASFTFSVPALYVAVGVNVGLLTTLSALDIHGSSTLLPATLNWTGSDGGAFIQLDRATGDAGARANSPAAVTITATDPATEKFGTYKVSIVNPVITPTMTTVEVGADVTLQLTDGSGNPVVAPPGSTWHTSNPTVLALNPILSAPCFPSCASFHGASLGQATVQFVNGVTSASTAPTQVAVTSNLLPALKYSIQAVPANPATACSDHTWIDQQNVYHHYTECFTYSVSYAVTATDENCTVSGCSEGTIRPASATCPPNHYTGNQTDYSPGAPQLPGGEIISSSTGVLNTTDQDPDPFFTFSGDIPPGAAGGDLRAVTVPACNVILIRDDGSTVQLTIQGASFP